MVDRYYRKIENVKNDIENTMQISSILLKLKGYDDKLEGLSKIGDNENNISTNSKQISTNKNDISTNLEQISTNKNNISSNLKRISTNQNNISSNLSKINDIKEFLISPEDFKKLLILKNKYLDLIEIHIFTQFLKKKLYMILLKIVYYL